VTDQFLAEIRIFPFNFPPTGWAFCNGQLLPLSQNTALFAILGTFYGGDGKSTFALPNLQSSAPLHAGNGNGPGLSQRVIGEQGGVEFITLLESEIPAHTHQLRANPQNGDSPVPDPSNAIARPLNTNIYQTTTNANLVAMAPQSLPPAGGSLPHNNMQPYLALNFCIALQGVFPPRGT
jgi:microcystin-dependent protein